MQCMHIAYHDIDSIEDDIDIVVEEYSKIKQISSEKKSLKLEHSMISHS